MARQPLSENEILEALGELPGWTYEDGRISRTFVFGDFKEAIGFIVRLAFHAEQQDHHPSLRNDYNRVVVSLCTHEADHRVTAADIELARTIQRFVWI